MASISSVIMDECESVEKPIRGVAKSGRIWKTVAEQPFSKLKKDKPFNSSWKKKTDLRTQRGVVKSLSQEIRDEKQRERQAKREKFQEKQKRRLENERKAEIVQVIKNTRKLKRMKKKQLRTIEKRDIPEVKT